METAGQNTKQVMEENDALKQLIELLNQQNMNEQSQDFMGVFWYVAGMQVQLSAMVDELQGVREQLSQKPQVVITYFIPDAKKDGGVYFTITGTIQKIEENQHQVIMENGTVIPMNDIYEIKSTIFDNDVY